MVTRIYTLTHREFEIPTDEIYVPLHVGASQAKMDGRDYGYLTDDSGDNISDLNCFFSELTGHYWVWKNDLEADIVGCCHYRRFLIDEQDNVLNIKQIQDILSEYQCITTKELELNYTYYYGFGVNHKPYYLDETRQVIADIYPEYLSSYDKYVNGVHTYFGNIMISSKKIFDDYCEWLFDILFELDRRIIIEEEDSYHRRIYGFISEFLWYLYVKHNNIKAYECKVGIIGEKVENREIKSQIIARLEAGDLYQAKGLLLDARAKRPDIMMEASDIGGQLHMCMEIIAIAEFEKAYTGEDFLARFEDFEQMLAYCNALNRYARCKDKKACSEYDIEVLDKYGLSKAAIEVSQAIID